VPPDQPIPLPSRSLLFRHSISRLRRDFAFRLAAHPPFLVYVIGKLQMILRLTMME